MEGAPRPKVALAARWPETALHAASVAALVAIAVVIAAAWSRLPATIAIHFDFHGRANGWGERAWILSLPAVAAAVFVLFAVIERYFVRSPDHPSFNYPFAISAANAERQYRLVWRLLLALRFVFLADLALVAMQIVAVNLGQRAALPGWTVAPLLLMTPIVLALYFVAARRAR